MQDLKVLPPKEKSEKKKEESKVNSSAAEADRSEILNVGPEGPTPKGG